MTDGSNITSNVETTEPAPDCPRCGKPAALCVCADIVPEDNAIELLILQHPQEQDRMLGTARLTALHFKRATLKIGLSWPSLSKILGRTVDPQRWAILYLGSVNARELAPNADVVVVGRKGEVEPNQRAILRSIEGVILLDGSWSQAKALWWRNPWMLKCRRVRPRTESAVALWAIAARATSGRAVDHRGGGNADRPSRASTGGRNSAGREFRAPARSLSKLTKDDARL